MKKVLFAIAFLIVGAGIAVGALMLTGRLADSTTPTRTTSRPAYTTTTIALRYPSTTALDAALAALCIDLQDRARVAVAALNYGDDEGRNEAIRAVGDLHSHCPPRYRTVNVPPAGPSLTP